MTAVIPGSFDPITTGHYNLVQRAAELFDSVTVLVCVNFDKEYIFTHEQRLKIAEDAFSDLANVRVEMHTGWLYEYLEKNKPCVLVKGIRNSNDYEYEKKQALFNFEKCGVETLYLDAAATETDTSSTKVRDVLASCGDWKKFIPQNAQKTVEKFYAEK